MKAGVVAKALVATSSKKRPASRGRDALAQLARAQGKA
jgi:hypothetical protein